ncbi:hypothetical protein QYF68_26430 [Mycolicibacterium austroafricanum]|uniref:Transcriptional regulator n=1 Tax=Mycolicibacterium austroafricanum TaxID=39687 RepID=A0ABT8HKP9_MYCAO|nr:hypothetical protein [Mycolicibacterium austroafricanum]MDN4521331.1 hypothetical protein [Mycolicibacterium austroafricanum]
MTPNPRKYVNQWVYPLVFIPVEKMVVVRYLGVNEVAARTGLSPNTIKSYSSIPGRMPQPDAMIGRVKGWTPETIDRWMERRATT